MVTNISMHAGEACVLRSSVSNEDGFPGVKKRSQKIANHAASRIKFGKRNGRACNLLTSTLISIAVFEKGGVALDY